MNKFRTGNIIMDPYGSILIFVGYDKDHFKWISFDAESYSGTSNIKTIERIETCSCIKLDEDTEVCEACEGTGTVSKKVYGEEYYSFLAPSAKAYVKGLLTKTLELL